jgi:hypothetical protein
MQEDKADRSGAPADQAPSGTAADQAPSGTAADMMIGSLSNQKSASGCSACLPFVIVAIVVLFDILAYFSCNPVQLR